MRPALSVIVPVYNEADRISATIARLAGYLGPRCHFELLVVDDGSQDGTGRLVQQAMAGLPELALLTLSQHAGKGAAVREGLLRAEGEVVAFCDADLSVPVEELETLLHVLGGACDMAVASRAMPESVIIGSPGLIRQGLSRLFNLLVRALFGLPFRDTQCGFKGFRREAAQAIAGRARLNGFVCDVELLILADRLSYRIGEIPVRYVHGRSSSVRLLAHAGEVLADLCRLWLLLRGRGYQLPSPITHGERSPEPAAVADEDRPRDA